MSSAAKRAAVAGELHKIVKPYGVVDGKNRKIYKSYAVIDGINRLIYMSENFAFTGAYEVSLVEIDGTKYDLYKLTTSGMLSIYADNALFWMCGGGGGGRTGINGPGPTYGSGGGGGGAYCTTGSLPTGKYPVEIGKGGAADTDGTPTTLGTFIASGGKTGAAVVLGGNGGTGGGGGDGSSGNGKQVGAGGKGDGKSKYPFGLTSLFAHCAGGGGGTHEYSTQYSFIRGGAGGTNGGNGKDGDNPGTHLLYALGGEKGGGHGGYTGDGEDASFYGSGGGGGGNCLNIRPSSNGKGGSGYQGVVYVAIVHKETYEPIVIKSQPQSQAAVAGDTVTFHVEATGVTSYQWQYSRNGGNSWTNLTWTGNTTASVTGTITIQNANYLYRCQLTAADGTVIYTDNCRIIGPIMLTKWPQSVSASIGETVSFTLEATGTDLKYRWYQRTNSSDAWAAIDYPGYDTPTITFEATASMNGYQYRCIITDDNDNKLTTAAVTLTVTSA